MIKRKFLVVLIILTCVSGVLTPGVAVGSDPGNVIAESVILAERDSGTILYEYNADERRSPDTMAKIMTVLLAAEAVESGDALRGEYVTASESAFFDITPESETRNIVPGESMPLIDLMYCAMVGGASEACNIIAEHISGSVEEFVLLMNERARELGCDGTVFVNTHGQKDARQVSTARDLYKITVAASENALFTEVAGAVSYTAEATEQSAEREMTNSNHMLNESRSLHYYKYAVFGKVSATYESGYGCIEYAERNGMSLICVLLGSSAIVTDDGTVYQNLTEAKRLFEWGYESFSWRTVVSTTELLSRVPVTFGDGADFVNLRVSGDVKALLPNDIEQSSVSYDIRLSELEDDGSLTAPIEAGAVLGELTVYVNGNAIETASLVADASIDLQRVSLLRQKIKAAFGSTWFKLIIIVAIVLFLAYAAIVIRYNILRARRVRQIQERNQRLAEERRSRDDFND